MLKYNLLFVDWKVYTIFVAAHIYMSLSALHWVAKMPIYLKI